MVLPLPVQVPYYQPDRPDSLQILISKAVITNNHTAQCSKNVSKTSHQTLISKYQKLRLNSAEFPNEDSHLSLISPSHIQYANSERVCHMPDDESHDNDFEVMSIELEQFWMEFTGVRSAGNRPVSFLESFPITIWLTLPSDNTASTNIITSQSDSQTTEKMDQSETVSQSVANINMSVVIDIGAKICAQLNHYQFCFLMRLADSFTDMGQLMADEVKMHADLFKRHGDKKAVLNTVDSSSGMSIIQVSPCRLCALSTDFFIYASCQF